MKYAELVQGGEGDSQTHTQDGDRISLLWESRLKL
jgi:hypothetical protein